MQDGQGYPHQNKLTIETSSLINRGKQYAEYVGKVVLRILDSLGAVFLSVTHLRHSLFGASHSHLRNQSG